MADHTYDEAYLAKLKSVGRMYLPARPREDIPPPAPLESPPGGLAGLVVGERLLQLADCLEAVVEAGEQLRPGTVHLSLRLFDQLIEDVFHEERAVWEAGGKALEEHECEFLQRLDARGRASWDAQDTYLHLWLVTLKARLSDQPHMVACRAALRKGLDDILAHWEQEHAEANRAERQAEAKRVPA